MFSARLETISQDREIGKLMNLHSRIPIASFHLSLCLTEGHCESRNSFVQLRRNSTYFTLAPKLFRTEIKCQKVRLEYVISSYKPE